jgi:prepilin-type N-terminal cleavage/methylation domain-containing protein
MHRRAFTMIEIMVVILVLALLAASIMPNVASVVDSNRRQAYRLAVPRMVGEGHNYAVQRGQIVTMQLNDDEGFELVTQGEEDEQVIKTLPQVEGVTVDSLLVADGSDPGLEWQVNFYPDGTSDGGVIELGDAGAVYRYQVVKATGKVRRIDPEELLEEDKWQAGDLAIRGGQ